MLAFTKPKTSTITAYGSVFKGKNKLNCNIKLYELVTKLPLTDNIRYIKYTEIIKIDENIREINNIEFKDHTIVNPFYKNDIEKYVIGECTYTLIPKKILFKYEKGTNIRKEKKTKDFNNSFKIDYHIGNRVINCKIYNNGYFHIIGCNSIKQIKEVFMVFHNIFMDIHAKTYIKPIIDSNRIVMNNTLTMFDITDDPMKICDIKNKYPDKYNNIIEYMESLDNKDNIFSATPNCKLIDISLKMTHFNIIGDISINQYKIFEIINTMNDTGLFATFENSKNRTLKIDYKAKTLFKGENVIITFLVFRSGKISMTNIKNKATSDEGYSFMTTFLLNNYKDIVMTNTMNNIVRVIKGITEEDGTPIAQKSDRWLQLRGTTVTASEVFKVVMKTPSYGNTYESYIREKALYLAHGIKSFTGNMYSRHGEIFEPLARNFYELYENNSNRPYQVRIFETPFLLDKEYSFLGASPDGLIVKFNKNANIKKVLKLEDIEAILKEDNEKIMKNNIKDVCIVDACGLEIKCPTNFHKVEKNLKEDKPHYYWQVQHQMRITDLKYTVFLQCKFVYLSFEEWKNDESKNKGYFHVKIVEKGVKLHDDLELILDHIVYPDNIFDMNIIPMNEEYQIRYWKLVDYDITEVEFDERRYLKKIPKMRKAYEDFMELSKTITYGIEEPNFELL